MTRKYRNLIALVGLTALALLPVGCGEEKSAFKEGEKFPPASPPADFVKEMNERRSKSTQPGPSAPPAQR